MTARFVCAEIGKVNSVELTRCDAASLVTGEVEAGGRENLVVC